MFSCTQCGESFTRQASLTRHVATKHTETQSLHECPKCQKLFSRRDCLEKHRHNKVCQGRFQLPGEGFIRGIGNASSSNSNRDNSTPDPLLQNFLDSTQPSWRLGEALDGHVGLHNTQENMCSVEVSEQSKELDHAYPSQNEHLPELSSVFDSDASIVHGLDMQLIDQNLHGVITYDALGGEYLESMPYCDQTTVSPCPRHE